jgi:ABC-type oligopeptide transport system substrate-binding subunit
VLNARAFDLAIVRWGADYPDPQNFLATQLGSSTDNITGWVRTKYDKVVTLADSYRPTDPRRIALFRQAADLAALKLAILPLDEPAQSALISPDLANVELTPLGTITGVWTRAVFAS